MAAKHAMIIGGGIAGLSTALQLARHEIRTTIVEQKPFLGGHAIEYTCKATSECAKCGACMVPRALADANSDPRIEILPGTRVDAVSRNGRYRVRLNRSPQYVDAAKCNACGLCVPECPQPGALLPGPSPANSPYVAVAADTCLHLQQQECSRCREVCQTDAIDLSAAASRPFREVDAVVIASGFSAYEPVQKPYGYGQSPDVVTNLDIEHRLRSGRVLTRPSTGLPAERVAFIQCVGSRDHTLGHLWCSRICCASALRMASLIRHRRPETEITVFYMDIQTIGRDAGRFYGRCRDDMTFVRAIPADIVPAGDGLLRATFFDPVSRQPQDRHFDLVVLSTAITPSGDTAALSAEVGIPVAEASGFFGEPQPDSGVFCCGTAKGPMGIADTIQDAGDTAWQVIRHLNGELPGPIAGKPPASIEPDERRPLE